ncbi:RES family NAD+ phosphorylase [Burkholderia sp. S-53]|uniref:RES family NAD+ phosphorylase n=1 Tax=Burkholderia sp. S-53 TaxID=2906514 RepID=UPI0021D124B1|nr:RES family NAD+ phosphorylase [Burkholderia sp. S-53]UXU92102.1 RES family NAD+ phosphorylase [Burkholderia sp. S-53]
MRKFRATTLRVEDKGPFLCPECVEDDILKGMIPTASGRLCCSCNRTTNAGSLHVFSKVAGSMLRKRFEEFDDTHHDYRNGLTLSQAFDKILRIKNKDVCDLVAEHYREVCPASDNEFFAPDMRYRRKRPRFEGREQERVFAEQRWIGQTQMLKHSRRYFNKEVQKFFSTLFDVALLAKNRSIFEPTHAAIRHVSEGKEIVRARRIAGADISGLRESILKDPKTQLGPPPLTVAKHNRMNPAGVPLFYGADNIQTAIAEVRPSIGDEVALCKFRTTRDLRLFDFTRFDQPLEHQITSHWLDNYEEREEALVMLKYLHRLIAQPARSEETDYVMTQAMAEFLHYEVVGGFDGIIFGSVQDESGKNYAIFEDSAKEMVEFPLEPVGKPVFHEVQKVEFRGTWTPRRSSFED